MKFPQATSTAIATLAVLSAARALIKDESRWTQNAGARAKGRFGSRGSIVHYSEPTAVCFCASGAVARAALEIKRAGAMATGVLIQDGQYGDVLPLNDLATAAKKMFRGRSVIHVNDSPREGRSVVHRRVLSMFNAAIRIANTRVNKLLRRDAQRALI